MVGVDESEKLASGQAELAELHEHARALEEEVLSLRQRLQDAPKRVRTLEERLLETKGQLSQAVSQNEKLTYTLREARDHIAALREEVDKLTQPPSAYGTVVGHIIYSPISVGRLRGAALGPMAVLPELQRQGIGSKLIEAGNRKLEDAGCPFIIVVGHPEFYPRFGFKPARGRGITCEWNLPEDVFMVLVLDEAEMAGVSGVAKYRDEFSTVT